MDYLAIAQSILQDLPEPDIKPIQRVQPSDDERIAEIAWMRMKLMFAERSSSSGIRYMTLV
ncbi:MAG: hypothetical protein ACFE0J_23545 [Elainellaceae cyanobacterium]